MIYCTSSRRSSKIPVKHLTRYMHNLSSMLVLISYYHENAIMNIFVHGFPLTFLTVYFFCNMKLVFFPLAVQWLVGS